jgi:aspartate/methionine/tyrosine aminotransferase
MVHLLCSTRFHGRLLKATDAAASVREPHNSVMRLAHDLEDLQAQAATQGMEEMRGLISFYKENARMLRETFVEMGFSVYGGKNAPYVWVGFPGRDSWVVFAEILDKCDIVTTPGSGFGQAGDGFVRVSAFGSRENVEEAIQRFKKAYGQ